MSRYASMFAGLGARGEGAFGAFLMLGHPDVETSATLLDAVVEGGADMVEVGIPFSDPVADGAVIQAAAAEALRGGVKPSDCFELLREFRERHAGIPIGILTYANLVVARGVERFFDDAAAAGVDSLLIADVPSLEARPFAAFARAAGLDFVMIAAPNTPRPTLERIARTASGYTYCVARSGITGVRDHLTLDHAALFAQLAELGAPPPILGFGISTPDHVRQALSAGAAGVVTGSALIDILQDAPSPSAASKFVRAMKEATLGQGSSVE